jgi:predicted glutamine amidotransferase
MTTVDRGYTCHFRYSTSGKVGKKQCHPFHIDDHYSLMMNGTIERLVSAKSVDTQELCKILAGLDEERILSILRTYSCKEMSGCNFIIRTEVRLTCSSIDILPGIGS